MLTTTHAAQHSNMYSELSICTCNHAILLLSIHISHHWETATVCADSSHNRISYVYKAKTTKKLEKKSCEKEEQMQVWHSRLVSTRGRLQYLCNFWHSFRNFNISRTRACRAKQILECEGEEKNPEIVCLHFRMNRLAIINNSCPIRFPAAARITVLLTAHSWDQVYMLLFMLLLAWILPCHHHQMLD